MNIDLHMHSSASDGVYPPAKLMGMACRNASVVALTDHDTIAGVAEAKSAAESMGRRFITGIEISTNWKGAPIHIVGLGVDIEDSPVVDYSDKAESRRDERAREIARRFEAVGIRGMYDFVCETYGKYTNFGRMHFARELVKRGFVASIDEAFRNHLGDKCHAYVPVSDLTVGDAIDIITTSGGIAVIAHPGRYKMSHRELDRLVSYFRLRGGIGIEVSSGSQPIEKMRLCAHLANKYGLFASAGSDFHGKSERRPAPGEQPPLPRKMETVLALLD